MATSRSTPSKRTPNRAAGRTRGSQAGWSPLANVPTKYHTPIFIGLILLSLLIFFGGVIFGGKFFATNDNISWLSFEPYLNQMAQRGEHPFWIPYIFSGMPAYAAYLVTGDRWWDLSMKILGLGEQAFGFNNFYLMRVVLHYFIYGIGMYLLMRTKKAARTTSLFVSLAAMFSTWVIVYIMIGHNTKISVLMTFPYIFICLERLLRRWSLLYAGLLILVIHILAEENHPQTAFYGACAVGIYILYELIGALLEKRSDLLIGVGRTVGVLIIASVFAAGMGLDRYQALIEYTPYSTRGAAAMNPDTTGGQAQDPSGGHGYKYATDYSYSPEEMITLINPSYFGFGRVDYTPPGGGQSQQIVPYWGQMPFTDAAHYMGISVLILGLFGAWMNRRNRFVQALMVIAVFGLLLSFGRTFPLLYDLFYYHFPKFNTFRAPSQSTVLFEFVFPILAGFGIESLIAMHKSGDNPKADRSILRATFIYAGLIIVALIGVNVAKSDYVAAIASAAKEKGQQELAQLSDFIFGNMQTDWLMAGFFGVATLLLMYFYLKGTLGVTVFKICIFGVLIFDLWRVDYRPMQATPKDQALAVFNPTDIDQFLQQDTTKYRILDLTAEGPNFPARQFHEHILGYHAAKLRNYQDLLDIAGNGNIPTSPTAWNMLNTKYIIYNQPIGEHMTPVFQSREKQAYVFKNEDVLPRAWFVNRVEVADGKTVLTKVKNNAFDPHDVAFVPKAIGTKIDPVGYVRGASDTSAAARDTLASRDTSAAHDSTMAAAQKGTAGNPGTGKVSIKDYTPNHFSIDVEAAGTNFLVISEVYYPSWHATIDGKPADIIQTDYLLRGMVIPPGKHTIAMEYVSPGFESGKYTSLILNLVMFGIIGAGYYAYRRSPEDVDIEHDSAVIEEEDV